MISRIDMALANDVQEVARVIDTLEEFGAANGGEPLSDLLFFFLGKGIPKELTGDF